MPYCTNLHYLLQSCAVLYILIFIYHLIFRSAEVLFATGIGSKGGAYSGWIWLQQSCNLPISKCEELTCRLLAIFDVCVILKPTLTKKKWTQKRVGIWNHTHNEDNLIHLEVVLPQKPVSPMEVAKPSLGEKWRIHEELMEKGFQRHSGTSLMTGRFVDGFQSIFVTQIGTSWMCKYPRRIFHVLYC